ncbi:MAG: type III pantothenate kinase [Flavobacteriaceae bacterium]|nr:type III pantothenate kinase [Flavobacteriaceae bacterium]
MNLVIDIGNTRCKVAIYKDKHLENLQVVQKEELLTAIQQILMNNPINNSILSSVSDFPNDLENLLAEQTSLFMVSHNSSFPFKNKYSTPKTLGIDRMVLVSGAVRKYPNKNVLIIDAGSCITYDFVTENFEYLGGAISPGLAMRYKSLHDYTAKLPFLPINQPENFIGNSTQESIHSGVVNGIIQEINGVIAQYKKKYEHLTIVLTGGDTNFLSKQLKSSIFANQNFLLEGLNELLIFNNYK